MEGKRHFKRINFDAEASIEWEKDDYKLTVVNLSLNGALLETNQNVPFLIGDVFDLKIHLFASDIVLQFKAKLVHEEQNTFGVRFLSEDVDTITHLRKVLELNLGDPEEVCDEMRFLVDMKDPHLKKS